MSTATIEPNIPLRAGDGASTPQQNGERRDPPTRLLQILKALEVEAASDVQDILRRSRAAFR